MKVISILSLGLALAATHAQSPAQQWAEDQAEEASGYDPDDWYYGGQDPNNPNPTPAPKTWPPTKIQMAVMNQVAYGASCSSTIYEAGLDEGYDLDEQFGYGHRIGTQDERSQAGDPNAPRHCGKECEDTPPYQGQGHLRDMLNLDHDNIIDAPATEQLCISGAEWSEQNDDGEHVGSAGRMYESGALGGEQSCFNYSGKNLGQNEHLCTYVIRGTDENTGQITAGMTYNKDKAPDAVADCGKPTQKDNVPAASYDFADVGTVSVHERLLDYYKERIKPYIAARRYASCKHYYVTGHSLGGVMASMIAMDGYVDVVPHGRGHEVYTFGALPFFEKSGQPNVDYGGFRLYHTYDWATNIDHQHYKHVHGSTEVGCVLGLDDGERKHGSKVNRVCRAACDENGTITDCSNKENRNPYTWEINTGHPDNGSKQCSSCAPDFMGNDVEDSPCQVSYHSIRKSYLYLMLRSPYFHTSGMETKVYGECNNAPCSCPRCCTVGRAEDPTPNQIEPDDFPNPFGFAQVKEGNIPDPEMPGWVPQQIVDAWDALYPKGGEFVDWVEQNPGPPWDPDCHFGNWVKPNCGGCNGCKRSGRTSNILCPLECINSFLGIDNTIEEQIARDWTAELDPAQWADDQQQWLLDGPGVPQGF